MESFRKGIIRQIKKIPKGRIFTSKDLKFDVNKAANVNVILSELVKKGEIKRLEKGIYYRFEMMPFNLGPAPVLEEEKIRYLSEKYNGYPSGYYIYNLMGLTEQVPTVATIAMPNPIRDFVFDNQKFNTIKSYNENVKRTDIKYLIVLDAIRQIRHIPARTEREVYSTLADKFFRKYSEKDVSLLIKLVVKYPPKVKMITASLLINVGMMDAGERVERMVNPISRYKYLKYRNYGIT